MSRVFLISSNTTTEPYPVYPLGMAVVAQALARDGHQVRQYDFLARGESEADLAAEIRTFGPELVSISLRNIDNVDSFSAEQSWYLARARALVELVRQQARVPVVVGGPALTIMPEAIADYLGVDHAVVGEGERTLCRLVAALAEGRAQPQVLYCSEPLRGDEFCAPLLDEELVRFYCERSGMVNLQTKRGCPFKCSYCTYPVLEGSGFRTRDPEQVVDDLQRMQQDHAIESVFFTDSIFNDRQGHYLELAETMIRRRLQLRWCAFFRPQGLGRQELSLLKRSGLYALELGTDAACDRTLAGINKGFSFAEVQQVNQACLDEELPAAHFIMFGGPEETEATVAEGLRNIDQLGASVVFAFSGIRILPDTPLHQRALADGLLSPQQSLLKPAFYFSPRIEQQRMEEMIHDSFRPHRNRIFPPSEGQERLSVMHRFGYRGLLWNKLISFKGSAAATHRQKQ